MLRDAFALEKVNTHVEILKFLRRNFKIPTEERNDPHVGTK